MDFAGYRELHPAVADALVVATLKYQREEAETEMAGTVAAVNAIIEAVIQSSIAIQKAVAARPVL